MPSSWRRWEHVVSLQFNQVNRKREYEHGQNCREYLKIKIICIRSIVYLEANQEKDTYYVTVNYPMMDYCYLYDKPNDSQEAQKIRKKYLRVVKFSSW